MTHPVETDLLERAREHRWWYSDTNMATLLMHEIERLREIIRDLDDHEGAEGWSEELRHRLAEALGKKQ